MPAADPLGSKFGAMIRVGRTYPRRRVFRGRLYPRWARKDEYNESVRSSQLAVESVRNQGVILRRTIKKFWAKGGRLPYRPTVESNRPSIESRGTTSSAESLRRGPYLQRPDRRGFDNRLEPRPGRKRPSCSRCEGRICPRRCQRRGGYRGHHQRRQCRLRRSLGRLHRRLGLFLGGFFAAFFWAALPGGLFLGRPPLRGSPLLRRFLLLSVRSGALLLLLLGGLLLGGLLRSFSLRCHA